mgnify:FL=1
MDVTRYDPFSALRSMRQDMERLFQETGWPQNGDTSQVATAQWAPAVDIKEEPDRFVIYADIPGVEPDRIEVTMERGMLSIKGERSTEKKEEKEGFTRVERARGTFYRRFSLPDTADSENIQARGNNGVLEVVIPKKPTQQARRIEVQK